MGAFLKVVDAILFLFFMFIAIGVPILDAQTILPRRLFPDVLVELWQWFVREFEYYLKIEKPSFYVGIVWQMLLFIMPLSLFNLYALLRNKSWFPTTCLIFGVSFFTNLATIAYDMKESGKASNKMIMMYFCLIGLSILAILRGLLLLLHSTKTVSTPAKKTA